MNQQSYQALKFGIVILGPPGCGKTTFATAMNQFCSAINRRSVLINLDPANQNLPKDANFTIDIKELVRVEDVMKSYQFGPNGGLVKAIQFLEQHFEWLKLKFEEQMVQENPPNFFILDLPGQAQLYISHNSVKRILKRLQKDLNFQFCAVHLIDSKFTIELQQFVSATFLTLSAMMNLQFPFISLISKMDLLPVLGTPAISLTNMLHFNDIKLDTQSQQKSNPLFGLTQSLMETIEAYQLVNFSPLNIESKVNMTHVLGLIDKALGYLPEEDQKVNTSQYLDIEDEIVDKIEQQLHHSQQV